MQNLIKIFTKTHQIVHFFKKFSYRSMPPSCVQLISLFLYERTIFCIRNAIKIYTKMHQLSLVFKEISGAITNLISNELL